MLNKIINIPVILGPTAVGKTRLALQLAKELDWEILSCDSRQIYRNMNIGTAKPSNEELNSVPHWLIDVIDPDQTYSAFLFAQQAAKIIRERADNGKTVLICGGTGLYFQNLSEGSGIQVESDPIVRDKLMQRGREGGNESLYKELCQVDQVSAEHIHANDLQRIVRALAVYYQTGVPSSDMKTRKKIDENIRFEVVKIFQDRDVLYENINSRVCKMFDLGLWDEFIHLIKLGYDQNSPGMQCVGYKELFDCYHNKCSINESIELIKRNSRRYAKRQVTWFTHQVDGMIFDPLNDYAAIRDYFLKKLK